MGANSAKIYIGDSDGSLHKLQTTLAAAQGQVTNLELFESRWVLCGDQLIDRGADDFEILLALEALRAKIERWSGSLRILMGNHELTGLLLFSNDQRLRASADVHAGLLRWLHLMPGYQGINFVEALLKRTAEISSGVWGRKVKQLFESDRKAAMLKTHLLGAKLCDLSGGVLASHLPPSLQMAKTVKEQGIEEINRAYRRFAVGILNQGPAPERGDRRMVEKFLTGSRAEEDTYQFPTTEALEALRGLGVTGCVFGHSKRAAGLHAAGPQKPIWHCGIDYPSNHPCFHPAATHSATNPLPKLVSKR